MIEKQIHDAIDSLTPSPETKHEILSDLLSSHSDTAAPKNPKKRWNVYHKAAAAAIVLCICSAIGVTAYANHFWGVRDLLIQNKDDPAIASPDQPSNGSGESSNISGNSWKDSGESSNISSDSSNISDQYQFGSEWENAQGNDTNPGFDEEYSPENPYVKKKYDTISVQGYSDTKEYLAAKEWLEFETNYDVDGSIVALLGNESNEYTELYPLYFCYSKEMADMIASITQKYDLGLHQQIFDAATNKELYSLAGTGTFITDFRIPDYYSYCYDDGTFHFDSDVTLNDGTQLDFQFDRAKKGIFSQVCLNIGNAADYTQNPYKCSNGAELTIALGSEKGLLIYDAKESFVVVNILCGTNTGLTFEHLQEFAEMFDFTQIP